VGIIPIIRALTLHIRVSPLTRSNLRQIIEEKIIKLREALDELKVKPWTIRITLQPLHHDEYQHMDMIARTLGELGDSENIYIAGIHIEAGLRFTPVLVQAISDYSKLYGSILVKDLQGFSEYVETLYKLYDRWEAFTRIALTIPRRATTPYFPTGSTVKDEGVSIALRYVDLVERVLKEGKEELLQEYFKNIQVICKEVANRTGVKCLGIDVSLSPWMEESVGKLIEYVSGTRIPGPGTAWAINWLNNLVLRNAINAGIDITGFNEIMLSVAEDNLLKEKALKGELKIRDLAILSAYCVAGIDMAAISITDTNKYDLLKILYDLYAAANVKKNILGVRLIPATTSPGGKLVIDKFNYIPVTRL